MSDFPWFQSLILKHLKGKPALSKKFAITTAKTYSELGFLSDEKRVSNLKNRPVEVTGITGIGSLSTILKHQKSNRPLIRLNVATGLYFLAHVDDDYSAVIETIENVLFGGLESFENKIGREPPLKLRSRDFPKVTDSLQPESNPASPHQMDREDFDPTQSPSSQSQFQYFNITSEEVSDFQRRFSREEIGELGRVYRDDTAGQPCANSEGIIRGLVTGNQFKDHVPDSAFEVAKTTDQTKALKSELHKFLEDMQLDRAFPSETSGNTNGILFSSSGNDLADPGPSFFKLALACHGDKEKLITLNKRTEMELPLARAVFHCVSSGLSGDNHNLNSLFFHHLSKIESLSPSSRAIASFIQSKNDGVRGAMDTADNAIDYALNILEEEFHGRNAKPYDQSIIAHLYADKTKNMFSSLSLSNMTETRVANAMASASIACRDLGINEDHFEKPDTLGDQIIARSNFAHSQYLSVFYYYSCEILQCVLDGTDASAIFEKQLILNKKIAPIAPRPACLLLTPLMGLSIIAKLPRYCKKLYHWKNGRHPDIHMNRLRYQLDEDSTLGTEAAIKWLTNYHCLKFLSRNSDYELSSEADSTAKILLKNENRYYTQNLKTTTRYFERFKADLYDDSDLYIKSECYPATSHHLFFGEVNDRFSKT